MKEPAIIRDFMMKVEEYLGEQLPPELRNAIKESADSFAEWGKSAAGGKCSPPADAIFHTLGRVMIADSQAMAAAAEEFLIKCYMIGYNGNEQHT